MLKSTRRGFLSTVLAIPLAYWSGFRLEMGVKPLIYHPLVPNQAQIYMNWLMKEHIKNVERAFLGLPFEYSKEFCDVDSLG